MRNHYRVESMGDFKRKWHLTCNGSHVEYFDNKDVADRVCDELNASELLKLRTHEATTEFADAASKLLSVMPQEPKWIPINADNMPKEGEEVLLTVPKGVFDDHEPTVLSGWFVSKYQEFEYDGEGRSVNLEDVIAWMPLPEPYKPQESEVEDDQC